MSSDNNSSISSHESSKSPDCQEKRKKKKITTKPKNKIIINISDCQYPVLSKVGKDLNWKLQKDEEATDWDVFWTDNAVQPQMLLRMQQHQKINHFPGMFHLSRKNMMGRYLMKMRKKFPDTFTFFPLTWMLPVDYHQLKAYYDSKPKGKARTFIVKPEAMSQGKGIFLTRKLDDIDQSTHCVVQRYMHKPFLIDGLKFDLRIYVLVAGVDPLRLFIFHEGLTRLATQKYEPPTKQNMEDVCMHLTNYAINKDNPKFVFNNSAKDMSKGHKRSLTWFFSYLDEQGIDSEKLKIKIEEMIVKTMIAGLPAISTQYRSCQPENYASNMCFELLGFDVMLTEKCEPVLLEINHTPSFSTDTPLDKHIKFNYIKDSLTLMNINERTKNAIIKQRREACQKRVITGKKIKLTQEEKDNLRKAALQERDKYEQRNLGGFKKIFPIGDEEKMKQYEDYLSFSNHNYCMSTGTKKVVAEKKSEKSQSAFGTCFVKKPKDKASTITSTQRATKESGRDSSTLNKKNYDSNKGINETIEKTNIAYSENFIRGMNSTIKSDKQKQKENEGEIKEEVFIKDKRIQEIQCLRKMESELQLRKKSEQIEEDRFVKSITPMRYEGRTIERAQKKNLKNVEILFDSGEIEEAKKTTQNTFNFCRNNKIDVSEKPKMGKINYDNEKKKHRWEHKYGRNSSQKQKIPITLNTLLISGFESNTNQSANNIKKYLCNQIK